jgi:hypothetical protein
VNRIDKQTIWLLAAMVAAFIFVLFVVWFINAP